MNAVELYRGPAGPAWEGIAGITLNGRVEVRLCPLGNQSITRSSYGKLDTVVLAAGMSLERTQTGGLRLNRGGAPECATPAGLKLEKEGRSPAELAEETVLGGRVLASSDNSVAVHPLAAGVKLVFVTSPDRETGEYLLADRENIIPLWRAFLERFPSSSRAPSARTALAALIVSEGREALISYRKSVAIGAPAYPDLQRARVDAEEARRVRPEDEKALALAQDVSAEVRALAAQSQGELDAYRQAIKDNDAARPSGPAEESRGAAGPHAGAAAATTVAAGSALTHLAAAQQFGESALLADPASPEATAAAGNATAERNRYDAALQRAQTLTAQRQYDAALQAVGPYLSVAAQDQSGRAVAMAIYNGYFKAGQQDAEKQDWKSAAQQFAKAAAVRPTPEAAAALKAARASLQASDAQQAASMAIQRSLEYEADKDYINAYETLYALPPPQRKLVSERMDQIKDPYARAASDKAALLQHIHVPIAGIADELGVLTAYQYLQRCYEITSDPEYQDRLRTLADELSNYYLQQGKRFLSRPAGTGAGVGWMYLQKALAYKSANADQVRDEMTRASSIYQLRSRLSIRVEFRDQTSRRDSAGFATQLADALATNLESSGMPVKIIRPGETTALEPNFQLIGDVLQAETTRSIERVPKESKYRASEHEAPNEAWNAANRTYEDAQMALESAQKELEGAAAHGKKKELKDAKAKVDSAQKQVELAHAKLDSLPKTRTEDVVRSYVYTQETVNLGETVELQFRILDNAGDAIGPAIPVRRAVQKPYTVLSGVKPEDTQGVRVEGEIPDEKQFEIGVETEARDALLAAAREKVSALPSAVLAQADRRANEGDTEGAAEMYILYLNSTPDANTPDRARAQKFLMDKFHFQPAMGAADVAQSSAPAAAEHP